MTPFNTHMLKMAVSLSLLEFSKLHIVHAWPLVHENLFRSPRLGFTEEVDIMVRDEEDSHKRWLLSRVGECLNSL